MSHIEYGLSIRSKVNPSSLNSASSNTRCLGWILWWCNVSLNVRKYESLPWCTRVWSWMILGFCRVGKRWPSPFLNTKLWCVISGSKSMNTVGPQSCMVCPTICHSFHIVLDHRLLLWTLLSCYRYATHTCGIDDMGHCRWKLDTSCVVVWILRDFELYHVERRSYPQIFVWHLPLQDLLAPLQLPTSRHPLANQQVLDTFLKDTGSNLVGRSATTIVVSCCTCLRNDCNMLTLSFISSINHRLNASLLLLWDGLEYKSG